MGQNCLNLLGREPGARLDGEQDDRLEAAKDGGNLGKSRLQQSDGPGNPQPTRQIVETRAEINVD